jgi:hypothetical protein
MYVGDLRSSNQMSQVFAEQRATFDVNLGFVAV